MYLLLFELQLLLIRQVLPLTTTTGTEVLAEGGRAYITIFYKAHHFALGKGVFFAANLYVAYVARHAEGYEYYQFIPMEQAFALGGNSLYRYALKER